VGSILSWTSDLAGCGSCDFLRFNTEYHFNQDVKKKKLGMCKVNNAKIFPWPLSSRSGHFFLQKYSNARIVLIWIGT